jgi:NADH-quinone oxidoreductase subunit M
VAHLHDINAREKLVFIVLAITVLGVGLYPLPFSEILHTSVNDLLVHLARSKL